MTPEEFPVAEAETEPEPPATIVSAEYDYDGVTVMLKIIKQGESAETPYALNQTDQYGLSPFLRAELERMVSGGEIVVQAAPPAPAEE